ncbi:MAG: ferredoxin:protochlorophyllide reductase (ATP-dependent) subunit B [[Chlorobium] sp. 445]|nr:MAG: ferredoxin:protochlorophyllide reductase (ATP-dependent) subunit B [[Chlorobium] sp. 445]
MRLTYWMYEGTAHHGVGRLANSLKKVHAVFHAPLGDDYTLPIHTMLERTPDFPHATTSLVTGRDLAQGTNRLPLTLKQVEARFKPELIVVCASCSTILLQENLQQVIDTADVHTPVLLYDANPYRMTETESSDRLFTLLVRRFAQAQPLTAQPSVNFLGPISLGFHVRSDVIAMRRMLNVLGIQLNVIAPLGASLDDLRRLPAAWLNIAPYRETGQAAAKFLEDEFGTPALLETPIGVEPTLAWLEKLLQMINEVGAKQNAKPLHMPPLQAFSLDGLSAPSSLPWFSQTADMHSFSQKRAFVFGDATRTVAIVKFLRNEMGAQIAGAGTYLTKHADWVRKELQGYLSDDLLVTEAFQDVAKRIEAERPDIVCGTQMERHSCRKFDIPCMVIAPPTHIENHLLGYYPFIGFDGADVIADRIYTTAKLGLEKHLIDYFGSAGLDYEEAEKSGLSSKSNGQTATTASQSNESGHHDSSPTQAHQAAAKSHAPAAESATPQDIQWTDEALKMLKSIPFFVREKAKRNIEKYAKEHSLWLITPDVARQAKEHVGA